MGLLLKEGIDINLTKSAFLAFSLIGFLIILINKFQIFKNYWLNNLNTFVKIPCPVNSINTIAPIIKINLLLI